MEQSQSPRHRYQVGDTVQWTDDTDFPETTFSGTIIAFSNNELTYVEVELTQDLTNEKELTGSKIRRLVLTEDDITRV